MSNDSSPCFLVVMGTNEIPEKVKMAACNMLHTFRITKEKFEPEGDEIVVRNTL